MTTLTLKYPIVLTEKKTISELKFKEHATGEDMLAFDTPGQNARLILLIASLTNTDESIIKKLHVTDYRAADRIVDKMIFPDLEDTDTPQEAADKRKNELRES